MSRASFKQEHDLGVEKRRAEAGRIREKYPDRIPPTLSSSMETMIQLKDLVPTATNTIHTKFILLEKGNISQDGKEKTCLALVADESASVHFQMWGTECDAYEPGDIVHLSQGVFCYHKKSLVLRAGRRGMTQKVGEFTMTFVETPNMSELEWGPDPNNSKRLLPKPNPSCYSQIFRRLS